MKHDDFFPELNDNEDKLANYTAYEQLHGDMGDSHKFHFEHGNWTVSGHGLVKTNSKCGVWRYFNVYSNVKEHTQIDLMGVSHKNDVFVHMVHNWCNNYSCPTCYLYGACLREAERATQRLNFASKGGYDCKGRYCAPQGEPQHIIVSPPVSDWDLAEFQHQKFFDKVKKIESEVGILSAAQIFHGFRYANYQESIEKGVLFGYYWSPHYHAIGFIDGGYGACRHCSKTARLVHTRGGKNVTKHGNLRECSSCDGFERRVRDSYKKYGYIISNTDERKSVFGTVWYQLSHMAIRKDV